jgi:SPP1 family predicted phage head-tail adaptor
MIARQYTRKIQLFKTSSVSDGFGGNTVNDVLIGSYWAEVKQNSAFKDNSIGNSQIKNNYTFKIRANINLDMDISNLSIVFNSKKYVVNDLRYDDELFRFVTISANGIQ